MRAYKILVLSRYSDRGASSRFRMFQYLPYFDAHQVQTQVQSLFADRYLDALYLRQSRLPFILRAYFERLWFLLKRPQADVIWIEKELFPWCPFVFEKAILWYLGAPYVLDYDDAVFHNYDLSKNSLIRTILAAKHPELMKRSAAIIAGNHYLATKATDSGARRVFEIPTVVSAIKYSSIDTNLSESVKRPVIGWIGSPSTGKYLELIRPVLKKLSSFYDFEFQIVGAKVEWSDVAVTHIPWSAQTEVQSIQNFDIGIMPLNDTAWEKGKCGFKIVQYMACGKPVVASNVGCNSEIIVPGQTGFVANSEEEWFLALTNLIQDTGRRHQMGQAGRERFEQLYSLEQNVGPVLNILKAAADTK